MHRPFVPGLARIVALAFAWLVVSASSTAAAPRRAPLTPQQRTAVLRSVRTALQRHYVFPAKVAPMIAKLDASERGGRYDVTDPAQLATLVSADLYEVAKDGHTHLIYDPDSYQASQAPPRSDRASVARNARIAARRNHGLFEMRRLSGNLRYLKIASFGWVPDETGAVYDAAMRFLRDGDAVIIDLRGNTGGDSDAVQYLVSHFLAPNTLEITFHRAGETPVQTRALPHLPAGRLTGKPLYVLVDGNTVSAGESFAYDVQQFKLGELVGARTAGAANNNAMVPIAPVFLFSVSEGRPVHPVSGSNWEGAGITPSLTSAPELALETAALHAVDKLLSSKTLGPDARDELTWARPAYAARVKPPTVSADRLAAFAGRYGDDRVVTVREGSLWMQRSTNPPRRLIPLTADGLFVVEGIDHWRVRFTGKAAELLVEGDPAPPILRRR